MPDINDFIPITGASIVSELKILANRLQGKKIINVNSTVVGNGVAEILSRILPLLQQLQVVRDYLLLFLSLYARSDVIYL